VAGIRPAIFMRVNYMRRNITLTDQFTGVPPADLNEETCRILHQCPHYRIGYGTRGIGNGFYSSFVEVAVTLLHDRPRVNVPLLEKDLRIVRGLQARGYALNCHDDACVSAELGQAPDRVEAECLEIRSMIEAIMSGDLHGEKKQESGEY